MALYGVHDDVRTKGTTTPVVSEDGHVVLLDRSRPRNTKTGTIRELNEAGWFEKDGVGG